MAENEAVGNNDDELAWRNPDTPCKFCGVNGCDCGCPTCRKAEQERADGTRTPMSDLTRALVEALKPREES